MTDLYKEISYGRFEVNGQVLPFKTLKNRRSFYTSTCNGLCPQAPGPGHVEGDAHPQRRSRLGALRQRWAGRQAELGAAAGASTSSPSCRPNIGGEWGGGETPHIWSHRFSLSGWNVKPFVTTSAKSGGGGGTIMVDDFVIMPLKACDGKTIIQIGVFAHEFGHAFGLRDLYDTGRRQRRVGRRGQLVPDGGRLVGRGRQQPAAARRTCRCGRRRFLAGCSVRFDGPSFSRLRSRTRRRTPPPSRSRFQQRRVPA